MFARAQGDGPAARWKNTVVRPLATCVVETDTACSRPLAMCWAMRGKATSFAMYDVAASHRSTVTTLGATSPAVPTLSTEGGNLFEKWRRLRMLQNEASPPAVRGGRRDAQAADLGRNGDGADVHDGDGRV